MKCDELAELVGEAITQRRIGTPVMLRLHAYLSADHGQLIQAGAEMLALAETWLSSKAVRVETRGGVEEGHFVVLAEFREGQTALLAAHTLRHGAPRIDFMLLGTQGGLYHEALPNAEQSPLELGLAVREPLHAAIRDSLKQKTAVSLAN